MPKNETRDPEPAPQPEGDPSYDRTDAQDFDQDLPTATLTVTAQEAVRATFVGGALGAAKTIVAMARGDLSAGPRIQFGAAKYVVEYALGKPKETGATDKIDELTEIFGTDEAAAADFIAGAEYRE